MLIQALSDRADAFAQSFRVDNKSFIRGGLFQNGYIGRFLTGNVNTPCRRPAIEALKFKRSLDSNLSQLSSSKRFYPDADDGKIVAGIIYIDVPLLFPKSPNDSQNKIYCQPNQFVDAVEAPMFKGDSQIGAHILAAYVIGDSGSSIAVFNRSHSFDPNWYWSDKLDIHDDNLIDIWLCHIAYAICRSSYHFLSILMQQAYTQSPRSAQRLAHENHKLLAEIKCEFEETKNEIIGHYRLLMLMGQKHGSNDEVMQTLRSEILFNMEAIVATISYHWGSNHIGGYNGEHRDFIILSYLQRLLQRLRSFDYRSPHSKARETAASRCV